MIGEHHPIRSGKTLYMIHQWDSLEIGQSFYYWIPDDDGSAVLLKLTKTAPETWRVITVSRITKEGIKIHQ